MPNPGSDAARKAGCNCAVMDNNHGRYAPWPADPERGMPEGWWITGGCPVHAPAEADPDCPDCKGSGIFDGPDSFYARPGRGKPCHCVKLEEAE